MKNILIVTVAGTSSRFSKSVGRETLKCIYNEEGHTKTILGELLDASKEFFDSIIIVGGFQFILLTEFIEARNDDKLHLVMNEHFHDFGSNYSLYLGLLKAFENEDCGAVVFSEGDLILDSESFMKICLNSHDVITANNEIIVANKSVAFYQNIRGEIKYIYDQGHTSLSIGEPFTLLANSGQVWKFTHIENLRKIVQRQTESDFLDSNLNIIEKYFGTGQTDQLEILSFKKWHNCNTVEDYRRGFYEK